MERDSRTDPAAEARRRRRTALAAVIHDRMTELLDQLIPEAVRASGLGERLNGYRQGADESMRIGLAALAADDEEREALLDRLAANMEVSTRDHHIPAIVERGLVSIGLRWALTQVREHAPEQGFAPAELEQEYLIFRGAFEEKLR